jgi:hypothetical protein
MIIKSTTLEILYNNDEYHRITDDKYITWEKNTEGNLEKWFREKSNDTWRYEFLQIFSFSADAATICDVPFVEIAYQKLLRKEKLNRILND